MEKIILIIVALLLSIVSAYMGVSGIYMIFPGAGTIFLVFLIVLEMAKYATSSIVLHQNVSISNKIYVLFLTIILVIISSIGHFTYLSKTHNENKIQSKIVIDTSNEIKEKISVLKNERLLLLTSYEKTPETSTTAKRRLLMEITPRIEKIDSDITKYNNELKNDKKVISENSTDALDYLSSLIQIPSSKLSLLIILGLSIAIDPLALFLMSISNKIRKNDTKDNQDNQDPQEPKVQNDYIDSNNSNTNLKSEINKYQNYDNTDTNSVNSDTKTFDDIKSDININTNTNPIIPNPNISNSLKDPNSITFAFDDKNENEMKTDKTNKTVKTENKDFVNTDTIKSSDHINQLKPLRNLINNFKQLKPFSKTTKKPFIETQPDNGDFLDKTKFNSEKTEKTEKTIKPLDNDDLNLNLNSVQNDPNDPNSQNKTVFDDTKTNNYIPPENIKINGDLRNILLRL